MGGQLRVFARSEQMPRADVFAQIGAIAVERKSEGDDPSVESVDKEVTRARGAPFRRGLDAPESASEGDED